MIKSESTVEISKALSKFRNEMKPVIKDANNPFFKSKYATLDAILEAVNGPLSDAKLSFAQFPDETGLTTILMHKSGEFLQATYSVPLAKQDPQGAGSAITYMRRYALGAILGIATENDDDGNVASTPNTKKAKATDADDFDL